MKTILILQFTCLLIWTWIDHTRGHFNVTDDTYFEIKWPGRLEETLEKSDDAKTLLQKEDEEAGDSVLVHADSKSSYRCFLPRKVHNQKYRQTVTDYSGPGPLALLQPLFEQKACSYKIESYWTYELCHGKHLRQYHEEMEGEKTHKKMEFFLGFYHGSGNVEMELPAESGAQKSPSPPVINIEGTNFPFFRVNFSAGSVCDLTKQPRQVELLYICLESGRGEIYELVEVESCKYRVVVMSKLLCQHPSFTVARPHVNSIKCRPADELSPTKPYSLTQQELLQQKAAENSQTSTLEGLFGRDVKIEATRDKDRVYIRIGSRSKEGGEEGSVDASSQAKTPNVEGVETPREAAEPPEQPGKTANIPRSHPPVMLLRRFVGGSDCVVGGAGWWRHELCFGRHVIQYHDDAQTGKRTTITLGRWQSQEHLKWIAKNPRGRPVKNGQFSLLFSGGDRCDETKSTRRVEVRIRCLPNSPSSSAMAIMLQEPRLCQYELTVESSMLCPLVNQVDDNGLLAGELKLD